MAEAFPSDIDLKRFGLNEDSEIKLKLMGFIKTPHEDTFMHRLTFVSRFTTIVTPKTTVRQLKDVLLDRHKNLSYEQLDIDYFTTSLSDCLTMKDLMIKYNDFVNEKYLRYTIIMPNDMFKNMYKSFRDLGMTEEKALEATNNFMETVHKKDSKFDYDKDASDEEKARKQLAKLEYENREQDKLHEQMWLNLTFTLSGMQVSDKKDKAGK